MTRLHPYHPTEVAESGSVSNGKPSAYVNEISVFVGNQKKRAQRRNAAVETLGPTPERLAKVDVVEEILVPVKDRDTRANSRATKFLTVFETHKARMPEHLSAALQQALNDFENAAVTNARVVGGYGEGVSGVPGPRHGGVPDHAREAYSKMTALAVFLRDLEMWADFEAYVVEIANAKRHAGFACPWTGKATIKAYQRGLDDRTIIDLARVCHAHQRRQRTLGGRIERSHEEVSASRMARREQIAKEGRR